MAREIQHFKEEIHELLDDRLNLEARLEVEKHLESCEQCRRELEALRWTKQVSNKQYASESVPTKLEEDILMAMDLEDRNSSENRGYSNDMASSWIWWRKRRAILAYGFLLIVAVVLMLSYFVLREPLEKSPELVAKPELSPTLELPSEVAQDYRNYKAEKLPLLLKTEDVKQMEKFFSEGGIPFNARVFDLGMMSYRLLGGRVHQLINRNSALFVYRGKGNKVLVCQMYPGQVTELPAGAVLRENKGIEFYVYRVNGLTAAFWQEGAVTCVLVSDIDPEEVLQLAFAKAVKV